MLEAGRSEAAANGPNSLNVDGVRTTCPYCGVGCGVIAAPDGAGGAAIAGDPAHPANFGRLCSKGSALGETLSLEDRLLYPEIDGKRTSWAAALDAVAHGFTETIERHGPDAVALYVSGQLLTEDYYALNKFAKGYLGTGNIDTNSRLCMASSVAGHRRAFGSDTVPGLYDDFEAADLVVLVGSNLAWCHPILFQRLVAARKQGGRPRVVVVDPRRTETCDIADLHLQLAIGSDVALFNGLLADLARRGFAAVGFVDNHTVGGEEAVRAAQASAPDAQATATLCGLPVEDVARFFAWFGETERVVTVYSQGVNQSSSGVDKVNAIVNCHLFTGRIGRPGMGPFSVTGQPNAMGGREVGALANQLAAHMDFAPDNVARVGRFWNAPRMATRPGLKAVELFDAVYRGEIKALWIVATNPVVSLPNADFVRAAIENCRVSVVSEAVRASDTVDACKIRLPALAWGEKDGTVTNSERRISRQRPFLPAPGEARPDWWIAAGIAQRMGFGAAFDWRNAADIFREHAALSAFENEGARDFDIGAHERGDDAAYDALRPFLWPAPKNCTPRTRFFADGRFYHADGRARLVALTPRRPEHATDATHPLRLNTGRVRDHWHTMTRTGKSPRLSAHRAEPMLQIHPDDAAARGLADGDLADVSSAWGSARLRVSTIADVQPGEVFAPMHWTAQFAGRGRINAVTNPAVDPLSGQPELKHTPVEIVRWPARWHGFVLSRAPLKLPEVDHWVRARGIAHWAYDVGGVDESAFGWQRLMAALRDANHGEWLHYEDRHQGRYRGALVRDDKLQACLYLSERRDQLPRAWLIEQFTAPEISLAARRALLVGRSGTPSIDQGPTVCVCFGVGRNAIVRAINEQDLDSEDAIGRVLKAGTNCGSCRPELRALLRAAVAEPVEA